IPIFFASAKKDIGVGELLDAFADLTLSPTQGKKRSGTKGHGDKAAEVTLEPTESGEFVGQVFKTLSDKFVGNLSFIRVLSGKIAADQAMVNLRSGKSARSSGLLQMQGKAQKTIPEAIAGDIIAVAKIEDLHIGDTVAANAN